MKNENNTQHTPGPWELSITLPCRDSKSEPTGVFYLNITHNGSIVTKCLSKDKNKLVANARLIASAPDLLKENEQLKEWKESQISVWSPLLNHCQNSKYLKVGDSISAYALSCIKESEVARTQMIEPITEKYLKEKAINAELLDALKVAKEHWNAPVQRKLQVMIDKQIESAIAKAEGKTLGVS